MIISFIVPEIWPMPHIFHFGLFFALLPPNSLKNEKFKKMKKNPGDIIILHKSTKNHDHMLYCSWDMVQDGCNCYFSFWAIFCPFTPLNSLKNKISKKWKKPLEISSFYTCVPNIMIRWSLVPEICCTTDRQKDVGEVGAPPKNMFSTHLYQGNTKCEILHPQKFSEIFRVTPEK